MTAFSRACSDLTLFSYEPTAHPYSLYFGRLDVALSA
jgi:hypothetical protein